MGKSGGGKKGGGPKAGGGPQRAGKAGGRAAAGPAGGKTDGRGRRAGDQSGQGGKARHCGASHRAVTAQFTAKLRQAGLQLAEVERDGARFLVGLGWGRVYFRELQLDPGGPSSILARLCVPRVSRAGWGGEQQLGTCLIEL